MSNDDNQPRKAEETSQPKIELDRREVSEKPDTPPGVKSRHRPWKRWRRRRYARPRPIVSRRRFLTTGTAMLAAGAVLMTRRGRSSPWSSENEEAPIRPPSADLDDARFRTACIGCGMCGTVCENGCIRYFGVDENRWGALTPYLDVRRRSCTLCMRCTQICPTGALNTIEDDKQEIVANVRMGLAVVDPDRCLSYLGRICGYCHDACPLPGVAIKLKPPARPEIMVDGCVGCGRCVELCPQRPTAIDLVRRSLA